MDLASAAYPADILVFADTQAPPQTAKAVATNAAAIHEEPLIMSVRRLDRTSVAREPDLRWPAGDERCGIWLESTQGPGFASRWLSALLIVLGCLSGTLVAGAEPARKVAVIGFLAPTSPPPRWLDAFRGGLREFGYVEGQNVRIEYQSANEPSDVPSLAERLVRLNVDVIVTWTTPAAVAVRQATRKIPIVAITGDPVRAGLVASLAHPGGNFTGLAILTSELEVKNLELLKEAVPSLSRVAVLWNPDNPVWSPALRELQAGAPALGIKLYPVAVRDPAELENALASAASQRAHGLLVVRDMLFVHHGKRIAELAAKSRLATIFGTRDSVDDGGLMSYGANMPEMLRRAANYVDKILNGAKPEELPVQQASTLELVVNLKTAKALGLTIPQSILLRADEVIK
jgi:putative ABC transport system substrate-binding protein